MLSLTIDQQRQFVKDGCLVLRQAVPQAMILAARHAINHNLGSEGIDPAKFTQFRSLSFCPSIQSHGLLTDLFNRSPVKDYCEALMGQGKLRPVGKVQVALRFPQPPFSLDASKPLGGHLDGIGNGDNGSGPGQYTRGFTVLAVIYLQDVLEPHHGNFTVWPGSHATLARRLREEGLDILAKGQPRFEWPHPPVQIVGRAGDVVLTHYNLIHTACLNHGPDVRYAAIARMCHVDLPPKDARGFVEPWCEFEPLAAIHSPGESGGPNQSQAGQVSSSAGAVYH